MFLGCSRLGRHKYLNITKYWSRLGVLQESGGGARFSGQGFEQENLAPERFEVLLDAVEIPARGGLLDPLRAFGETARGELFGGGGNVLRFRSNGVSVGLICGGFDARQALGSKLQEDVQ